MKNKLSLCRMACFPVFLLLILCPEQAIAQQQVVQLSGMVLDEEGATGMAGVAVFVPQTNRGTNTNSKGFFSLPVLPGDSVVVAALGYQRQYFLIPHTFSGTSYSTLIYLLESTTALPTVNVMPWATERELREAISKIKLPEEPKPEVDLGPLEQKDLTKMPGMDAEMNAKYGLQQAGQQQQRRYMVPSDVKVLGIGIGSNYKKKKASRGAKNRRKASIKDVAE